MSTGLWRRAVLIGAAVSMAVPALLQPATAVAANAGPTLFAVFGESHVVKLDPATGATTQLADLSAPFPGAALGDLVSDPSTHTLYSQRAAFVAASPPVPPTLQMVSINTQTGTFSMSPVMPDRVGLAIDQSSHSIFGLTSCCPVEIVRIDPASGVETQLATPVGTNVRHLPGTADRAAAERR
jgi:hypothetical protein